jgi:hypothetical protein
VNEFSISKRMITLTIDEDLFQSILNAVLWSNEPEHSSSSDTWKFIFEIERELHR